VSDLSPTSETNLYAVEFRRHPRDLGVVVVLAAESRTKAIEQAWRLFPEYKRDAVAGCVYTIQYAEIDWDNGRTIVMRRKTRPTIPKLIETSRREKKPREEEEDCE
jgi:hypothetical protein